MPPSYDETVRDLVTNMMLDIRAEARHIAAQTDQPPERVLMDIIGRLRSSAQPDGRTAVYRARLLLWRGESLEADTNPDLPLDYSALDSADELQGLKAVMEWATTIVSGFHGAAAIVGWEEATLRHSLKSLRPSLSRAGGRYVWRIPYTVDDVPWMAHIWVRSENATASV